MAFFSSSLSPSTGSLGSLLHGKSTCCRYHVWPSPTNQQHTRFRKVRTVSQCQNGSVESPGKKKIANLFVERRQTVPVPIHVSRTGKPKPLDEFLCHQAGMESMLNVNALQTYEPMGNNSFRCTLPKLEILGFEVAPIVDLSVAANKQECIVEMLSCKFQGSELVESQNERFSASMRNHLTWNTNSEGTYILDVNVQLNVSLEVYTVPFTLLPTSAVETPGNVILQAMVDRMVPIFLHHLLDDYLNWSQVDDDHGNVTGALAVQIVSEK